jgi:hypothetical protein
MDLTQVCIHIVYLDLKAEVNKHISNILNENKSGLILYPVDAVFAAELGN